MFILRSLKKLRLTILCSLLACQISSFAVDLQLTDVNGKKYYVYEVQANDTKLSVCKALGIKSSELVKYNAWAEDGIARGQKLYFPVNKFEKRFTKSEKDIATDASTKKIVVVEQNTEALTPVNPPVSNVSTDENNLLVVESDVRNQIIANTDSSSILIPKDKTYTIAVVLPFELDSIRHNKRAIGATDYYRGLLLAADTLSSVASSIKIKVLDAGSTVTDTRRLLSNSDLKDASVIIGSSNSEQFDLLAKYAESKDIYIVNSFIVKDSTYLTNPKVVQTYIDQSEMYDKAIDYLISLIDDNPEIVPVILNNKSGDNNKEEFVELATQRLASRGISPIRLNYDGNLTLAEIGESLSPRGKYLFIPISGSLKEFNRFAHSTAAYISTEAVPLGGNIIVFGYPEWTAFRSTARELLSKINARIYSRFYADIDGSDYKRVNESYKRWYGREFSGEVPSQALLGYDTGIFLIRALSSTGINLENASMQQGIQSSFDFKRAEKGAGLINNTLYTIEYLQGDAVNINVR